MVRARRETVRLIWIQAVAPCGPAHCGPPRPHCNFISCRGDNERRVASTHQTPGKPIPTSQRMHAHKHYRKDLHMCMCMRKHGNPLTHFLHSLSHIPTLFPPSSTPAEFFFLFPPAGLWWAEGAGFLLGLSLPSRFRTAELRRRTWWRDGSGDDQIGFDIWNQL